MSFTDNLVQHNTDSSILIKGDTITQAKDVSIVICPADPSWENIIDAFETTQQLYYAVMENILRRQRLLQFVDWESYHTQFTENLVTMSQNFKKIKQQIITTPELTLLTYKK